ncbi:MAG: hypothetical protein V4651_02945 [Bacteroidota bacterium]
MSDQRTNDPNFPDCQVSLICFTLTDPTGKMYNYYTGMVDLPADTQGGWSYVLDNSTPQNNNPITYNEDSNTFTVGYTIPESLYNPNGAYKTFLLPIYTDQAALSANIQMNMVVNINLISDNGSKTIVKHGTVSTIRTVHGDGGASDPASLQLINYVPTGNPEGLNCWNAIINSCTQPSQYFIVLWACIPQSVGAVWPLMYKPNASVSDPGSSNGSQIICNWWYWNDSPAVNRGIPAPDPIPAFTTIIGSIEAINQQYTTDAFEGNDQGPNFGQYYQEAESL